MAAEPSKERQITAPVVLEISLDAIESHPANARTFPAKDSEDRRLIELAASIAAVGLLEPILVRHWRESVHKGADNHYQLLAGERRWRAMRLVPGATTIAAIVRDVGDREALEILVTENLQREDLSPLEEARGVRALVDEAGWTMADVADRLGRSLHWVALRARLTTLSPRWQTEAANPKSMISHWPAGHLELIARLEPAAQDGLLGDEGMGWEDDFSGIPTRAEIERDLARLTRELRRAPWKLADAALHPDAGSCLDCHKRSACHPGLFEDEDPQKPEKTDRCLDATCWTEKLRRHLVVRENELRAQHRDLVLVHGEWHGEQSGQDPRTGVLENWRVEAAKKGEAGAIPALVVDGKGAGTLRWIKPARMAGGERMALPRGADGKPAPATLAQRRASLDRRRRVKAVELIAEQLKNVGAPDVPFLVRLAAVFGTKDNHASSQYDWGAQGGNPQAVWNLLDRLDAESVGSPSSASLLWDQVREVLLSRLRYLGSHTDVKRLWSDAEHLCESLCLDAAAALRQTVEAIPQPKSWARLKADGTPKAAAPAKGKGKAEPKRARKAKPKARICRECGCTDENACETETGEPCHWVEEDLCSACAPGMDEELAGQEQGEATDG